MNNTTHGGFYAPDPRPWWKRQLARFFPRHPAPMQEPTGALPGSVHTVVTSHLDWRDRLRIALSGRCLVEVHTQTDVKVGVAMSESVFTVLPPAVLER